MPKLTPIQEYQLCLLYKQGFSTPKLQKKFNISEYATRKILEDHHIKCRSLSEAGRTLKCNHHFFDEINSEKVAYWIGFILADGYISKNNHVGINLAKKDRNHLEKFKIHLQSEHKIIKTTDGRRKSVCYRFEIPSPEMCSALSKLGFDNDKTFTAKVPDILIDLERHMYRGLVDGDGHIYKRKANNKWEIGLCGTYEICESFRNYISKHVDISVRVTKHSSIYRIRFRDQQQVLQIAKLLYSDATIYLDRKYNLYQQLLSDLGSKKFSLSSQDHLDICQKYASGKYPYKQLCKQYHISYVAFKDITKNITKTNIPKNSKRDKEICSLYTKGLSALQIASRFHLTKTSVYNIIRKHGIILNYHIPK